MPDPADPRSVWSLGAALQSQCFNLCLHTPTFPLYFGRLVVSDLFLQASFSVSDNRTDIDINDPNFWQKWAKKADIDVDVIANKVTPGNRTFSSTLISLYLTLSLSSSFSLVQDTKLL